MIVNALILAVLAVVGLTAAADQQGSEPENLGSLRRRAEGGDAKAQLDLGRAYENGAKGTQRDQAEAIRWYRKAAEQGNVEAATTLAYWYMEGRGVPRDFTEAARWYGCPAPAKSILTSCKEVHYDDLPDGLQTVLRRMKCESLPPSNYDYGVAVDLNGDGVAEYQFCCGESPHGPCPARLFGKIGSTWRDITADHLHAYGSTCGGIMVLESSHNRFNDICLPSQCSALSRGTCVPALWQFRNGRYTEVQYTPVKK
uniref:Sel1 domain protein repeat-containing protein n=1 Tax=Solibacter usitatus (strain Ellin6076) TaxID=234267 RepID=Q01UB4_SOLUE